MPSDTTDTRSDAQPESSPLVGDYPSNIADALFNRGLRFYDRIATDKAFDEFCSWHGLIGWGPELRAALDAARATNPSEGEPDEGASS